MKGFEGLDPGYMAYVGTLLVDNAHNNPCMRVFCAVLTRLSCREDQKAAYGIQFLPEPRTLGSNSRAARRWHLAYTLVKNPDLLSRRKLALLLTRGLEESVITYDAIDKAQSAGETNTDPTFRTPNIDALHAGSVRLNASYSGPNCSPSRAALLSAVHPFRWGLQDNGINAYSPAAIPLTHEILPQAFKRLGYQTHMIGKWHQGSCKWELTPTYRGYDSFVGIYLASGDYFAHVSKGGYDMRFNERVYWEVKGTYSTTLYSERAEDIIKDYASSLEADPVNTKPFFIMLAHQAIHKDNQVPPVYLDLCSHKNLMDNLLIVFTSDNGGSYLPEVPATGRTKGKRLLCGRGASRSLPSFTVRATRFFLNTNYSWSGLFYTTDWYATLMGFATKNTSDPQLQPYDGFNQWQRILQNGRSRRKEMGFVNEGLGHAYVRYKQWKLLERQTRSPGWYNPPEGVAPKPERAFVGDHELYNIDEDPFEEHPIYPTSMTPEQKLVYDDMVQRLRKYKKIAVPTNSTKIKEGDPSLFGNVWSPGWC
ncbi:arylsulfatase B-like [Pomacea canaliculata]|uniref:arylsulfatase B-like n=1 Tax=Pomacea canaliculata TaxID=400727 RepID=UPI000D72C936|nr:arylsulfatase B-like [Pomacea canaliculata]